jgi:hypothetical protein
MMHKKISILGSTFALVCGASLTSHAYVINTPWRGDSLPQGSYMRTSGHLGYDCANGGTCALDINGIRWDSAAQDYSDSRTTVASSTNTTDDIDWGMPLYSPVDGDIVACWRSIPDDGENGEEPAAADRYHAGAVPAPAPHQLRVGELIHRAGARAPAAPQALPSGPHHPTHLYSGCLSRKT